RVTIALDAEVPQFHDERLSDPPRVFVDLPSTRAAVALGDRTLRFDGDQDVVRQVRIGRHPNATTRVVLEEAGVASYSVYELYNPYRLVIDCARMVTPRLATTDSRPVMTDSRLWTFNARPSTRDSRPSTLDSRLSSRPVSNEWGRRLPLRR